MFFPKINISRLLSWVWWNGTQIKLKKMCLLQKQYGKSKTLLCRYYLDMVYVLLGVYFFITSICSTDGFNQSWSKKPSFSTTPEVVIEKLRIEEFNKFYNPLISSWMKSERMKICSLQYAVVIFRKI